ncbi:MAG: DSD1 family PLP-dependent enzyme [Chromatiales bacterium]|nr:DSD1 family PLP-dependent enzyme [Chromatiales bacterium]
MSVDDVDTPALIVDLDAFDANLTLMAEKLRGGVARLRPHAKTHKCPSVALRQIAAGAVGVACQKVGEAEAMVAGGVDNVLVTNQIVGPRKLSRLSALARRAWIGVCVDAASHVDRVGEAAGECGTHVHVLVEIDVGASRCGVADPEQALLLAQQIEAYPNLSFGGLQAYQGSAQHKRSLEERRAAIDEAVRRTRATVDLLANHGLACPIVGGAGTGTFELELKSGVYTELQAGSYVFMDADYARNQTGNNEPFSEFRQSLHVLTTVMSTAAGHAVVDAGHKAQSADSGLPEVADIPNARYVRPSDEHAIIQCDDAAHTPTLGQKIRLIPGHCDPTVNLYDWLVGVRVGRVESLWPITARGATR